MDVAVLFSEASGGLAVTGVFGQLSAAPTQVETRAGSAGQRYWGLIEGGLALVGGLRVMRRYICAARL